MGSTPLRAADGRPLVEIYRQTRGQRARWVAGHAAILALAALITEWVMAQVLAHTAPGGWVWLVVAFRWLFRVLFAGYAVVLVRRLLSSEVLTEGVIETTGRECTDGEGTSFVDYFVLRGERFIVPEEVRARLAAGDRVTCTYLAADNYVTALWRPAASPPAGPPAP